MRHLFVSTVSIFLALIATTVLAGTPAYGYPPTPPAASTAQQYLNELTVRAEGSTDGYSRDLFPHWHTVSGSCDTRETVLKRDGSNVVTNSACQSTSGDWYSVYDAVWVADDSDIDIDHIVPLAEAWKSGANAWTTAHREEFANDLTRSQLIAVSASSNRSKSDKDPSEWQPPNGSVHCIYAREWIWVKHYYGLSLQSSEKTALQSMLNAC